ncbi:hypothetical protein [Rhizobium sp. Root1220]|uniref:hypothetical protein n=1 Tax=Rhizobium sp. Root1220 TaxID=1736432 RepID=UPI0006F49FF1|nr:hypothetical protein [Rhizobium sp. Root1220]KQV84053.1 hypothetical protein ASC90_00565 [Rhizobium sp. Root1220]
MSFRKAATTGLIAATLAIASIVASTPAMAHGGGGHGGGGHGGGFGGGFGRGIGGEHFGGNDRGNFAMHNDGFAENTTHSFGRLNHRGFHRFRDNGWDTCYPDWWQERHVDTFQNECY